MKKTFAIYCLFFLVSFIVQGQNQAPVISNLSATPNWVNHSLEVTFDVADNENDPLEITLQFSDNSGKTYTLTSQIPTMGDVGFPIQPGSRSIHCDLSAISNIAAPFSLRLVADDKQTFDIQSLVNGVDSNRMRANLEFVEGIRHRTAGSVHLNATRDSIKNLFLNAGLQYEEQAVPLGNYTGKNLIGNLLGTSSAQKVVINDAHYDSVSNAPGADDNGSGTVGMMEAVRILSPYPSKKTLRFIGFDLEEAGLVGSIRYVSNGIPAGDQIEGVFNHEMIGYWSNEPNTQTLPPGFPILFPDASAEVVANQYRGDFITNVGNATSISLAQLFSNAAQQYVPGLKVITLNVPGDGSIAPDLQRSDHAPFWAAGKKALMLTDGANFRNLCYHTPGDTLNEKLNFTFMSNVVKASIAAMAELAEIQHGDWATATFQSNVGVFPSRPLCDLYAYQQPGQDEGFVLEVKSCAFSEVVIELYDMKGSLLLQQDAMLPDAGAYTILTPNLPEGVYVLKIRHADGIQAQKIMLR
ncbi:MAG: M28 family peptidase [Phycisphaerae bacterium]|nr:M28 family peptidase [Saprospiraceae bacterium]